jgi:hypothetical protein
VLFSRNRLITPTLTRELLQLVTELETVFEYNLPHAYNPSITIYRRTSVLCMIASCDLLDHACAREILTSKKYSLRWFCLYLTASYPCIGAVWAPRGLHPAMESKIVCFIYAQPSPHGRPMFQTVFPDTIKSGSVQLYRKSIWMTFGSYEVKYECQDRVNALCNEKFNDFAPVPVLTLSNAHAAIEWAGAHARAGLDETHNYEDDDSEEE